MIALEPAEALAERLIATHRKVYAENPRRQLLQQALVVDGDGRQEVFPFGWGDRFERALKIEALRAVCAAVKAVRVAMWGEAWIVEGADAEDAAEAGKLHQHPRRVEVVFTSILDAAGPTVFRMHYIERDRKGRVTGLREKADYPGDVGFGGELMDLLPRGPVQ